MFKFIDSLLDRITMYRLVLYILIAWVIAAVAFSAVGILPYDPFAMLLSTAFLIAACWVTNKVFAKVFNVPANVESVYISALILALIINPIKGWNDLWFLGWASVLAMSSKYIVNIGRKHIFNPVTFAVALTALAVNQTASWWIGTASMLPLVLIGGLLIVRKIQRFDLVFTFLISALITGTFFTLIDGANIITALWNTLLYSPLIFFGTIILTEPLTTPPTLPLQMIYGALTGFLFAPQMHIGSVYTTPEAAMMIGNVFSYLVSPKVKLVLQLVKKIQIAPDIYDFIFVPKRRFAFAPGQYMEWTLGHDAPDSRGNRRTFTLANAPTEDHLRVGVKFYPNSSTYKQSMLEMRKGDEIVAAQLAGDFTLPTDPHQPIVLIAGGIGVTPFRSMLQYLLDRKEHRPITLFFSNRTADEIVYSDVFNRAASELGIPTIHTLTDTEHVPQGWSSYTGHISAAMIAAEIPNYEDCLFYISGPMRMIEGCKDVLRSMHIPASHIKTDFFPGLV